VTNSIIVLVVAALMTASAAGWTLRAYSIAGGGTARVGPALVACGAVALVALGAYLVVGRPELPDAPYSARLEALRSRDPSTYSPEDALAILDQAAKDHPADARPHFYSGQILLDQGRAEDAARQFDAALRRDPQSAEAMLGLGRAMVRVANGRVTPEALAQFQQAAALSNEPAPWIYQAMAAMQSNRAADAQRFWGEAYTRMAPDDPRREMARRMSAGETVQ
jgi:cytochrome c-type biogenesis protein CcmH